MSATIKVALAGVNGRMGKVLVEAVAANPHTVLTGALEHAGSEALGLDAGHASGLKTGVTVSSDIDAVLANCDVLIDFTRPHVSGSLLPRCAERGIKMVIGTTGFDEAGKTAIAAAAEHTGIVFAANFSIGVNLTFHILDTVTRVLNEGYDIEIIEAHHRHKVDAPSGTALRMGEVIARGRLRRVWPRRPHRRTQPAIHRLCHRARRRYRGRTHRPVCRRRRARGNHPQSLQPHDLRRRRRACRRVAATATHWPIRYARRIGLKQPLNPTHIPKKEST